LHSSAPPMAYELVEQALREAYGASPKKVFRRFEERPFAAASIGQVHRAELRDGTPVAVKVQYPGVRDAIDHDLANMGMLVGMAGLVALSLEPGGIVHDLKEGIRADLDDLPQAANQQRFYDLFEGHAFIRVPRISHGLTTCGALVEEFIEGRPFA